MFFTVIGTVAAVTAFVGVAGVIDASEPTYWGTYTEEYCEPRLRGGCHSIGTWVSDDGSIRLDDVRLDGSADPDGTVRAEYGPTGLLNDAQSNIVHAEPWASGSFWVPWLGLAVVAGVTVPLAAW